MTKIFNSCLFVFIRGLKILLVAGLVLIAPYARAADYQCPEKVETKQSIPHPPKGWSASIDTSNDQIFDSITLFDGPPAEMASLAPDNEESRGPVTWTFDEKKQRTIYLQCNYRQTAARLTMALPDSVTQCTYNPSSPGVVKCICACSTNSTSSP